VAEDEKLVTRKELFDLGYFLGRDGRDGITLLSFWFALEQYTGGGSETREHDR
jgi:hypothetical protein